MGEIDLNNLIWNLIRFVISLLLIGFILLYMVPLKDKIVLKNNKTIIKGSVKKYEPKDGILKFQTKKNVKEYRTHQLKSFNNQPYRKGLISTWKELNLYLFLPFFFIFPLSIFLTAYRWKLLLNSQGIQIKLGQAALFNWIGLFWNNISLGLTGGDVAKAYLIGYRIDQKTKGVLSVFVDRLIGMSALVLISLITSGVAWLVYRTKVVGMLGIILFLSILVLTSGIYLFFHPFFRELSPIQWIKKRLPFQEKIRNADRALKRYSQNPSVIFKVLGISFLNHVVLILICCAYGFSLGISEVNTFDYFIFYPPATLISSVPVSVRGWGVGEISFVYLFSLANVAGALAFSLSVLMRLTMTIWSIPGGIIMNFTSNKEIETNQTEDDRS